MADYNLFRQRLRERGFRERYVRCDEAVFGSWVIDLDTNPPGRVAWEGKDGWLVVQTQRDDEWINERVIRSESEQTPEIVIESLPSVE